MLSLLAGPIKGILGFTDQEDQLRTAAKGGFFYVSKKDSNGDRPKTQKSPIFWMLIIVDHCWSVVFVPFLWVLSILEKHQALQSSVRRLSCFWIFQLTDIQTGGVNGLCHLRLLFDFRAYLRFCNSQRSCLTQKLGINVSWTKSIRVHSS